MFSNTAQACVSLGAFRCSRTLRRLAFLEKRPDGWRFPRALPEKRYFETTSRLWLAQNLEETWLEVIQLDQNLKKIGPDVILLAQNLEKTLLEAAWLALNLEEKSFEATWPAQNLEKTRL